MVLLFTTHMQKSIKLLYQCSKIKDCLSLIQLLGCCIMLMNRNSYLSKLRFLNRKIKLPIWTCQLQRIHQIRISFMCSLIWKIKKINLLMFSGVFYFKIKHLLKIGLESYNHSKIKKYKKWWMLNKKRNNKLPIKINLLHPYKIKNSIIAHGFMIH